MPKSNIQQLLEAHGLGNVADAILDSSRGCLRLVSTDNNFRADGLLGASKLGGNPDLAKGVEWPVRGQDCLAFLAQINLGELPQVKDTDALPKAGLLSFFYDADNQPWGFDPNDVGSWRVIFTPEIASLHRRDFPEEIPPHCRFTYRPLLAEADFCLPSWERQEILAIKLSEQQMDAYDVVYSTHHEPESYSEHRLMGWPHPIQNDDMETECQLASNGVNCGGLGADPRVQELSAGAADWVLLLQLDSDDGAAMMWGDVGRLYFWIKKQDLAARVFDKTWVVLQCC